MNKQLPAVIVTSDASHIKCKSQAGARKNWSDWGWNCMQKLSKAQFKKSGSAVTISQGSKFLSLSKNLAGLGWYLLFCALRLSNLSWSSYIHYIIDKDLSDILNIRGKIVADDDATNQPSPLALVSLIGTRNASNASNVKILRLYDLEMLSYQDIEIIQSSNVKILRLYPLRTSKLAVHARMRRHSTQNRL
jgi:hypothetical protein